MSLRAVHFRLACRLALVAMLALALLPTVSHALAASRAAGNWTEVCSPQGLRLSAAGDAGVAGERGDPGGAGAHLEHCPFCAPSASALGMPSAYRGAPLLARHDAAPPPRALEAPRRPQAWHSAQPRAPPVQV